MDSYYTVMGPALYKARDSGKEVAAYHFSLMKSIVHLGDSKIEVKDFNKYLSQPEAQEFQEQQHKILLGKGVLQAIGRTERRDYPGQTIKIFINEEFAYRKVFLDLEERDDDGNPVYKEKEFNLTIKTIKDIITVGVNDEERSTQIVS